MTRDGRRASIAALLVALASIALYARTLGFDFVEFDDHLILLAHPNLYAPETLAAGLRAIFVDYLPREEPLVVRDLSWLLDSTLFGFTNPLGYHLGNVLWNALDVGLVLLVVWRLVRSLPIAVLTAVAFAILPVHVEPVAWVMGRKDLLSAAFMLLAILAQDLALERARGLARWALVGLTGLLAVLAILAKVSAISLLPVLVLHRLLRPHLRGEVPPDAPLAGGRALLELLPIFIAAFLAYRWYSGVLAAWGMFGRGPATLTTTHFHTLITVLPAVLWRYLVLLVVPRNYSVSYEYPSTDLPPELGDVVGGWLAVALYAGLLLWSFRRRRDVFFFLAMFGALMVPYLNLVYIGIWVANRYLYLSVVGLLVPLIIAARSVGPPLARPLRLGAIGFALLFTISTIAEQSAWADNHALWLHETSVDRPTTLAYQALARSYLKRARAAADPAERAGLVAAAEETIDRGLALQATFPVEPSPYYTPARENHAKLYYVRGQLAALRGEPPEAQLVHYREAHRVRPDSPLIARTLADTLVNVAARSTGDERLGRAREALGYFLQYAEATGTDPLERARNQATLASIYAAHFPELAPEIQAAQERYFP